ncbi:hypothetical protein AKJ48_03890 [candidate division MSBL1 archaeon SCGC-AAA261O19]|uniref:4Fe-4S domain-containing protein n=2 Tax=candidate division MSBL1 TaxID=215777 RepID=A0A133UZT7_9EURY|nr:hypothetical protein AKJ42_02650 [candidate division MSBL1 archaeon SCGC-AAA261C02]KXB03428.1 hypothetical protein AKJ48_03890 [candidate division MSBL1 archaeon SCGC-AAA261O19]
MLRPIIIGGYRKSGKTQLIKKLVKELSNRGYRVGTIKHVPQEGFTLDQPESDTWRHAQAGADPVISISPEEVATLEKRKASLEEVLLSLHDLDFVVIEGFRKSENIAKIITARSEGEAKELNDEFTIGFIGHGVENKPVLDQEDVDSLADLIEQKSIPPVGGLDCGECGYDNCREFALAAINGEASKDGCTPLQGPVILRVDGERIPIKSFVKDVIGKAVSGIVSSLKGAEGRKIEIEVEKDER